MFGEQFSAAGKRFDINLVSVQQNWCQQGMGRYFLLLDNTYATLAMY